MYLKNLDKRKFVAFVFLIILLLIFKYFIFKKTELNNSLVTKVDNIYITEGNNKKDINIKVSLPIGIKIPSIKVDAKIESLGVTKEGLMDSPVLPDIVGWFSIGVRPGEIGSAVLDGHSGWKNNLRAVFDDLYKINIGDKIYIEDKNSKIIIFIVKEIRKYKPDSDATSIFVSNDGIAHLNIITCAGVWNINLKSHSDRLIVFSDME